jgi:hypothetical protein
VADGGPSLSSAEALVFLGFNITMRYISLHFTWQILEHERSRWAKELRRREGAPNCRGPLVFELTLTNERYATAHTNIKLSQILRKFQFSGHFRTVHFFIHPVVYKIK